MSISDTEQNPLIMGIKLVLGQEHIRQFVGRNLPPGMILIFDSGDNESKIEQYDFINKRCEIQYVTEAEAG